ncbi:MAG TPA: ABC transporter ATP-binding protein [Opitutales bacterium]|nr:ABC transporter ATP-binding protein [Opitutales bacterium]
MPASHSGSALRLDGIRKNYGSLRALDGLSLEVPRGSIFGLVGPNGAGKTTTFAIMCGLLQPDSGAVSVLGGGPFSPRTMRGRLTALPQDAALGRDLTVTDLLTYLGRLQGIPRGQIRSEVARILKLVDLADRAQSRAKTLSHGMLRRVGIGQAFLGNPELVLLDEPTNGLDPRQAHEIRQFIATQRGHRAVVISSHNLHEIETICDRMALIDHGRLVRAGTISEITGQNEEVCITLGAGPAPLELLKAALAPDIVAWEEAARTFRISYRSNAGHEAEEVIGAALRVLLENGARISTVERGQSLERAFLELPNTASPPAL